METTYLELRYFWKEISEDGLLKDPTNSWGGCKFSAWGYKSREEAFEALKAEEYWDELALIETYCLCKDDE